MDKQTLSNYGWIVVCVLVLATLLAFATPFSNFLARGFEATSAGFEFTSYQMTSDVLGEITPTSLEELQERHKFEYYSSLALAVDDINAGTIGKNADRDKDDAVAGIYTDRGKVYAVLLKNNTEERRVIPQVDMTINIGGNTLSSNDDRTIWVENGNVIIDGRLEGSTIYNDIAPDPKALQVQTDANVELKKGTYIVEKSEKDETIERDMYASTILVRGELLANETTVLHNGIKNSTAISSKGDYANALIQNSIIKTHSTNGKAAITHNTSKMTFKNCEIEAISEKNTAFFTSSQKYEDAVSGIIVTNIYDSRINILSKTSNAYGIRSSIEVIDGENINIENSIISVTSESSNAKGIFSTPVSTVNINIKKSDIIATGTSNSTTYGISGNEYTNVVIDRSTVLANKHLKDSNVKNSIGIDVKGQLTTKYSSIFGTICNIK